MDASKLADKEIQEKQELTQSPRPGKEECSCSDLEECSSSELEEFLADINLDEHPLTPEESIFADNILKSLHGYSLGSSSPPTSSDTGPTTVRRSERLPEQAAQNLKNASLLEPKVLPEVTSQGERIVSPSCSDSVTEIDLTVKKYTNNLLHALERVTARLSQLESQTQNIESSIDDLKLFLQRSFVIEERKLLPFDQNPFVPTLYASPQHLPKMAQPVSPSVPQMSQLGSPSVPSCFPSQMQPVHLAHQQSHQVPQSQPQPQPQPQQGLGTYHQSQSHPRPQVHVPHSSKYAPYSTNPTSQPLTVESNHAYWPPRAQSYSPRGASPCMQQPPRSGSLSPAFDGPSTFPPFGGGMYDRPTQTNLPGYGPPVNSYPYGGGSPSYRPGVPFASGSAGGGADIYENLHTTKLLPLAATPTEAGLASQNSVPLDDVMERFVMLGFLQEKVRETVDRKISESGCEHGHG